MDDKYVDYRHVWLYSKHWYQRSDDVFADLAEILAERGGMDAKYFKRSVILEMLAQIAWPYMRQHEFLEFVQSVYSGRIHGQVEKDIAILLVTKLLTVLSLTTARQGEKIILNLGKPDFTILPEPEKKEI